MRMRVRLSFQDFQEGGWEAQEPKRWSDYVGRTPYVNISFIIGMAEGVEAQIYLFV